MDEGVLYVQVLFRVPIDLDESTGLMKYDSKYKHSIFSGLYMLLQVRNILSQGKFEQELDLVRCPRQQSFDYVNGQPNTNSDNRKPATIQQNPGITPAAPIPTILVSGGNKPPSVADATDTGNTTTGQDQPVAIAQATTPPPADQTAADLAEINATAPTADISAQNQPQATTDLAAQYQAELVQAGQRASAANDAYVNAIQSGASQAEKDRLKAAAKAASDELGRISARNQQFKAGA